MKLNTLLIGIFVISIFSIGTLGYYTIKSHHDSDIEFFISLSPSDSGDILEFEQNEESEILKSFFIILSTSLVLSIMVGYVINRSVGKPIKKLSNTIDEVSRGNLEVKIDEKILENKGEIGDLARSLKRILVSLKIAILRKGPAKKLKLEKRI
jgi:two-component system, sensor histidine kinase YesM